MERLFKVLNKNGSPIYGTGTWSLAKDGQPGKWMPPIKGALAPCANGYHLCREHDLIHWLGPTIYEAEHRGDRVDDADKVVVREARLLRKVEAWTETAARLFACDCAERVLHIYEKQYPNDKRPRRAIEIARQFAAGHASRSELAAAWAAAWAAARAAAWAAAGAAAWAAARDAVWAAGDAAGDAVRAAAGDAARAAAWAVEHQWQTRTLLEYLGYPVKESQP